MVWPAVIAAGASIAGSAIGAQGAKQAAKDQRRAANRAAYISNAQNAQARADMAPYMSAGYAALAEQRRQLGLGAYSDTDISGVNPSLEPTNQVGPQGQPIYVDKYTGDAYLIGKKGTQFAGQLQPLGQKVQGYTPQPRPTGSVGGQSGGRYGAFEASPGYQFALDQGTQAIDRNNAARGRSYSGASLREATRYAAGMASQEYDNYFNRLSQLAGNGQNATNANTAVNVHNADNQGTASLLAGASRASGVSAKTDMYNSAINTVGGVLGDYFASRESPWRGSQGSYGTGVANYPLMG